MWELFPPFSAVVANFIQFPTSCQFPIDGDNLEIIFLQIIEKKNSLFLNNKNVNIDLKFASLLFIYFLFFRCLCFLTTALHKSSYLTACFAVAVMSRSQKDGRWRVFSCVEESELNQS